MIEPDLVREICMIGKDAPMQIVEFRLYKDVVPTVRAVKEGHFVVVRVCRKDCSRENVVAIAEMIAFHVRDKGIKHRSYPSDLFIKFYR
jgi:hypothetical protein